MERNGYLFLTCIYHKSSITPLQGHLHVFIYMYLWRYTNELENASDS